MAMNAGEIIAPMFAQYQREQREQYQREQREKEREKFNEQREKEREKFNNLRQLEIGQEVKKYKTPAAKRAVSFLLESKNDWNDCFDEFKSLVGDDGNLISLDENKDKVESFLKFFARFSNMRTRKNKHELESYKIANSSVYGWLTEKCYNDDLFDSGNDTKWYEKDEESPAKKLKRLREAEKEAARLARPRESYDEDCDDDDDY